MLKADLDDSVSELGTVCDVSIIYIEAVALESNRFDDVNRNSILN
jgi:hypothetical protein